MMNKHIVSITLEAKYGAYPAPMQCLYDPADRNRPCWPYDENGEPYPDELGTQSGCVYLDWWDNQGLESLGGPDRTIRFELSDAEWADGFTFMLGKFLDCTPETETNDEQQRS